MPLTVSKGRALGGAFLLVISLSLLYPSLCGVWGQEDSAATGRQKGKERVKIRIDEDGISIESGKLELGFEKGEGGGAIILEEPDTGLGWGEEATRGTRLYKEKGMDIVRFGEDVSVARDELVRGNIVVFGGDVLVEGRVVGDVVVLGGDIRAESKAEINGDACVLGGTIEEGPEVIIHGDRVVLKRFFPFASVGSFFGHQARMLRLFFLPVRFFIWMVLSFLIVLFIKDRMEKSEAYLSSEFLKSFAVGLLVCFVGIFVVIVVVALLAITLIGIPLAILVVVSCFGVVVTAWTVFAYALGLKIREKANLATSNPFIIVFIGALVLYLPIFISYGLSVAPLFIPLSFAMNIFGKLVFIFAEVCGIGALFLSRFGGVERPGVTPVPETAT